MWTPRAASVLTIVTVSAGPPAYDFAYRVDVAQWIAASAQRERYLVKGHVRALFKRKIYHWRKLALEIAMARILGDTDDLHLFEWRFPSNRDTLAQRILIAKVRLGKNLVDNRDWGRTRLVALIDLRPGEHRDLHRRKKPAGSSGYESYFPTPAACRQEPHPTSTGTSSPTVARSFKSPKDPFTVQKLGRFTQKGAEASHEVVATVITQLGFIGNAAGVIRAKRKPYFKCWEFSGKYRKNPYISNAA